MGGEAAEVLFVDDALHDLEEIPSFDLRHVLAAVWTRIRADPTVGQPMAVGTGDQPGARFRLLDVGFGGWRIVYLATAEGDAVTIWLVSRSGDHRSYEETLRRLTECGDDPPAARPLLTLLSDHDQAQMLELARMLADLRGAGPP